MTGRVSRRGLIRGGCGLALGLAGLPAAAAEAPALTSLLDQALQDGASSLLIVRDDEVLAERHAPGWDAGRPREVASVAKSMVAVLIGMAIDDGFLGGLDQSAADFIPAWRDDGRRAITLRHLMSMTSGLNDAGLALRGVRGDQFAINAAASLRAEPGTRWAYNTAAYHLLFHILVRATDESVESYAERRLLGPLGMMDTDWITNEGRGADGPVTNYYSAASTARDLARFGGLVMDQGAADGQRLIDPGHVRLMTTASQALNPSYGLLWWCNAEAGTDATGRLRGHRFPRSPRETVAALGAGGQALMLVPSRRMAVVRQGEPPRRPALLDELLAAAVEA